MKTTLKLLAAAFAALCTLAASTAFGQGIVVKPVVASGPLSMASGAMPGDFAALDDLDTYTPAQASTIQRIFYGIEIIFPAETTLVLSEVSWTLVRSSTTPWKTGNVAIWSAPTASSSPYMVAYNVAGAQVSANNATSTGTTVSSVKRFVIGNHKWTLGTNPPAQQPMLVNMLDRYCMGYRIVGTAGGAAFAVIPPNSTAPAGIASDRLFGGHSTVGVVTPMTKVEWLAQLQWESVMTQDGTITVTVEDPSGVDHNPSGYYMMGLQWSTDLQSWFHWDDAGAPHQESNLRMGSGAKYYITPGSRPRLFFRSDVDRTITHTEIPWWPTAVNN